MPTSIEKNVVRRYPCSSWEDFELKVRRSQVIGERIFRGQRELEWGLSSPFERRLNQIRRGSKLMNIRTVLGNGFLPQFRDGHLARFKDYARGTPEFDPSGLDENEWWALGRHHGLVTPLLDWTLSPYVAAYFAYIDRAEANNPGFQTGTQQGEFGVSTGQVAVWELVIADDLEMAGEFHVIPARPIFGHRQKAQQGLFTKLDHAVHLDVEAYLASRGIAHYLAKYELPDQDIGKALGDLRLMNITPATMFPDLGGAASMANVWHLLRSLR